MGDKVPQIYARARRWDRACFWLFGYVVGVLVGAGVTALVMMLAYARVLP